MLPERRIVRLSLPGAFTPTPASNHLPPNVALQAVFLSLGIGQILCLSVHAGFVLFQCGQERRIRHVFLLRDGHRELTCKVSIEMSIHIARSTVDFGCSAA